MGDILWEPTLERKQKTKLFDFMNKINHTFNQKIETFEQLHTFSISKPHKFWDMAWDYFGVRGHKGDRIYYEAPEFHQSAFFPDATLNFAQNLLVQSGDEEAIIFWSENKKRSSFSFKELQKKSLSFSQALTSHGIKEEDRIAAYVPNVPDVVSCMLGVAAIGAIWSSCSPDFGISGVVDRFSQIEPKILITTDGYIYGGKTHSNLDKISEILERIPSIEKVIVIPFIESHPALLNPKMIMLEDFTKPYSGENFEFKQFPFAHPLYILFSSGTTGKPKCIVHAAGRILLQHLKEHQLHTDVQPKDRVFYFTTCGWMMWNWQITALASRATLVLYDGSPFACKGKILLDLAEKEQVTLFGTSAKYIDSLCKTHIEPLKTHNFSHLRTVASTGSPLSHEGFEYIYRSFKEDVQLSSVSGGTDIVGCFALGNPMGPVYIGELQALGLGMAVDVFDEAGHSIVCTKGELVCTKPFMSQPIKFWNDENNEKFMNAYFNRYPNIWHHGDYVERTKHNGLIIYGRSDATLNPGGVRIGTAEIYRQVEKVEEVLECFAICQDYEQDVRIILFVKLRTGVELSDALKNKIKQEIRDNTTPRHVPAKIICAPDIPKTKSGKITEIAVRELIHGRKINNLEAIANPEALIFYETLVIS